MSTNLNNPFSEGPSSSALFERVDKDVALMHHKIRELDIVLYKRVRELEEALASLKNGWTALGLAYDVFKLEVKEPQSD